MNLARLVLVVPVLVASSSLAQAFVDPCLQCGAIYSSDGSGRLFVIDPATGTSTLLSVTTQMFDIAISADGQLWGVTGAGELNRIDTCSGTAMPVGGGIFGNGLGGDVTGTFLFAQGPPLTSVDPAGPSSTIIGGAAGPTSPPDWCGYSSGDLAMDGVSGLLFSSLGSCGCPGDTLVTLDPVTGDEVARIGCFADAVTGSPYGGIFGLAFGDDCGLVAGAAAGAYLLDVDMATGLATQVPITGGYDGTFGLASIPCTPCKPVAETCAPLTQGFWKRQCKATHPSGEHELLPTYVRCVARTATFRGIASVDEICDALNPDPPNDKCEQAEAQFMALLLNNCSGRLGRSCCIDSAWTSAATVGEAIDEVDGLLSNPARTFRDCVNAQGIADDINTAHALCPPPPPPFRAEPVDAGAPPEVVEPPRPRDPVRRMR